MRAAVALVSVLAITSWVKESLATPSAKLVYVREAGTSACPAESDLRGDCCNSRRLALFLKWTCRATAKPLVQSFDKAVATSISGVHVKVTEADGTLIREFTQTTAGFVEGGGYGLTDFIGIDAPTRDILLASLPNRQASHTVVVHVDLLGSDPATGSAAGSPEFQFPVSVCNGCLVSFATGNDVTSSVQPNCLRPAPAGIHVPCALGQDETVACELCAFARPICNPLTP